MQERTLSAAIMGGGFGLLKAFQTSIVAERGSGTLNVTRGRVESGAGTIGEDPSGVGIATFDGPESTWISSGILRVGLRGTGTLNITGGSRVEKAREPGRRQRCHRNSQRLQSQSRSQFAVDYVRPANRW